MDSMAMTERVVNQCRKGREREERRKGKRRNLFSGLSKSCMYFYLIYDMLLRCGLSCIEIWFTMRDLLLARDPFFFGRLD